MKKQILPEHNFPVKKKDNRNGIAVHVIDHNHRVDWEDAKVLEKEPRYWKRRTLEAIHIQKEANKQPGLWFSSECHLDTLFLIANSDGTA